MLAWIQQSDAGDSGDEMALDDRLRTQAHRRGAVHADEHLHRAGTARGEREPGHEPDANAAHAHVAAGLQALERLIHEIDLVLAVAAIFAHAAQPEHCRHQEREQDQHRRADQCVSCFGFHQARAAK
jgi:hypothetical protein